MAVYQKGMESKKGDNEEIDMILLEETKVEDDF